MDLHGIPAISLAITIIYLCFTYYFKRVKMSWGWSFITNSLPVIILNLDSFHQVAADMMQRENGTTTLNGSWFGACDFIVTADPANVHYITTSNFSKYPKGDEFRKISDVTGYFVFNSDGEDWKHFRQLTHTFLKSLLTYQIKTAHAKLENVLAPLLKHASEQNDCVLNMQDVFQRYFLDVVFKSATGHDPESLAIDVPTMPFIDALADFEVGVTYRVAVPVFLWKLQLLIGVGPESRLSHAREIIGEYLSNIVFKKRHDVMAKYDTFINASKHIYDDFADLLTFLILDVMKDDGITKTQITHHHINDDDFFKDIILQYIIAGRDTTSSAMTWFIWLIATHPEVEDRVRDELRETVPGAKEKGLRVFNYEETSQLVYLHAALNESLRLYPPVPNNYRTPSQPDVLPSGHHVHPKMKIIFSLYAMARMSSIWGDNCSKFDPERWITDRGTIKHEPASKYFVFHAGPRICMGKDVAMTQMKMVAATLLHNFRFEPVEDQNIHPDISLILHVKNGLKVRVHNRWT